MRYNTKFVQATPPWWALLEGRPGFVRHELLQYNAGGGKGYGPSAQNNAGNFLQSVREWSVSEQAGELEHQADL
jgi:hypothetical protein